MGVMEITPDYKSTYQDIIINLPIANQAKRVIIELRYLEKTDLWYVSLFDVQKTKSYLLNVPLLASTYNGVNDLWAPFKYKRVGIFACFPRTENVRTKNPSKDNLSDFIIVWSDGRA